MWIEISKNDSVKIDEQVAFIKNSAPHYATSYTKKKMLDMLERKQGRAFYYDDGKFKIALNFLFNETNKDWKMANVLVKQVKEEVGTPKECMGIIVEKVRNFLQEVGGRSAYCLTPKSPFNPFQDKIHQLMVTDIEEFGLKHSFDSDTDEIAKHRFTLI